MECKQQGSQYPLYTTTALYYDENKSKEIPGFRETRFFIYNSMEQCLEYKAKESYQLTTPVYEPINCSDL